VRDFWKKFAAFFAALVVGGLLYFLHDNFKENAVNKASTEYQGKINTLEDQLRSAQIEKESAIRDYNSQHEEILSLEKENRDLRDEKNQAIRKMEQVQVELNEIKSRIIEVGEYDCAEIFDNEFIICLYQFKEQESIIGRKYAVDVIFEYSGLEEQRIAGENSLHADWMFLTEILSIQFEKRYYVVRLLQIDYKNKNAKFSLTKTTTNPE